MPANYAAYYPLDDEEEAYLRYLEAPGEDLGRLLGDAPRPASAQKQPALVVRKSRKPSR